ncbi:MAG: hypothetical protein ACK4TF_06500 [Thermodesulfovibrionales bacterium]
MPNIDSERGREVATILHQAWMNGGFLNEQPQVPEAKPPEGVEIGSREHLLFLTLTVSIDYMRDADQLWNAARATFNDPETCFLFFPERVVDEKFEVIRNNLQIHQLALRPERDAKRWHTIAKTLHEYYHDSPLCFIESYGYDAPCIQNKLRDYANLFPGLSGDKISSLWLRILYRCANIPLNNLKKISIPVDTHIFRATINTKVITGIEDTLKEFLKPYVRLAWDLSLQNADIMPLDIDEPLWHLSRKGCSEAKNNYCPRLNSCPVNNFCIFCTYRRGI